jgi:hypothetical protein
LAYYKNIWDKFCQFCGNFCQFCRKYYLIGIFGNHSSPVDNNFGKFLRKIFLTTRTQSEKVGQISFRHPNFFLPVRPCVLQTCILILSNLESYIYLSVTTH